MNDEFPSGTLPERPVNNEKPDSSSYNKTSSFDPYDEAPEIIPSKPYPPEPPEIIPPEPPKPSNDNNSNGNTSKKNDENKKGKIKNKALLYIILSVVVLIILAIICKFIFGKEPPDTPKIDNTDTTASTNMEKVPNVVGMEQSKATELLTSLGFTFHVWWNEGEADSDKCYVIEQSIPGDSFAESGADIALHISDKTSDKNGNSDSSTLKKVPNVIGMEQNKAADLLKSLGFKFHFWWYEGENECDLCYVVEQSIPVGSYAEPGAEIALQISGNSSEKTTNTADSKKENDEISTLKKVPNVTGMEQNEAIDLLTSLGFTYNVWWYEGENTSETNYVIEQSIPGNSYAEPETEISLHIASNSSEKTAEKSDSKNDISSTLKKVPNVVGMEQNKAAELLTSLGFTFHVWWNEGEADSEKCYVIEQSIPGDSFAEPETDIALHISKKIK